MKHKNDWKLIFHLPMNHKLYYSKSRDRHSIADCSGYGKGPFHTDDGPLLIHFDEKMVLHYHGLRIPVHQEENGMKEKYTFASFSFAETLFRTYPGWRKYLSIDPEFQKYLITLSNIVVDFDAITRLLSND